MIRVTHVFDITDEEIAQLPHEPGDRFVALERIVRRRYEEQRNELGDDDSLVPLLRRYTNIVLSAARTCDIEGLASWERPLVGSRDEQSEYIRFMGDVDYYSTDLRLRSASRSRQYSVALDAAAKLKLRHLISEIRSTLQNLDVSVSKRERLLARLNALQSEVDRERTKLETFGALMIEASGDLGEAAKRLEPVVQIVERIGAALGIAKQAEDAQAQLPPPQEKKRIEPPRNAGRRSGGGTFDKPFDDEIPF